MYFRSHYLLPLVLLIGSALAALWGGLLWLTALQNDLESDNEIGRVAAAFQEEVANIATITRVFAVWDDAATKLVLTFDPTWAKSYEVDYLRDNYGYTTTFITDERGSPLFAYVDGRPTAAHPAKFLGKGYREAMRRITRARPLSTEPISGVTNSPHGLKLFGISRIRPHSPGFAARFKAERYLVVARPIDAQLLSGLSAKNGHLDLVLARPGGRRGSGAWEVKAFDGAPAAALSWTPKNPGSRVYERIAPWLAVLAYVLLTLTIAVLVRAYRATVQLQASETKARYIAGRDPLTGLPNRRAFSAELLKLERSGQTSSVLYMDLDGFKEVNDTFGHGVGDNLLRRTAERLQQQLPPGCVLARLGGDEFAVAIAADKDDAELAQLASGLIEAVNQPHYFGGAPTRVGVSIGIARAGSNGRDDLMRHADTAMYAAKSRGRNGWAFYDPDMDAGRRERKLLEEDLREAVAAGQITLVYQPVISARDGHTVAVEALARWTHPVMGPISPDVFIPIAEESGLIVELGNYILENACAAAKHWPFRLAVNLSPAQFWSNSLLEDVTQILARHSFAPERLEFEITETYLLSRPELAAEIVSQLRELGIGIALDDFGSGYASIGYLRMFDLEMVKIDRSLVEGLGVDSGASEVLTAIVSLCRALNLSVIAENVETRAQAEILRAAGCHRMQGWYFGYPVTADEIAGEIAGEYRFAA